MRKVTRRRHCERSGRTSVRITLCLVPILTAARKAEEWYGWMFGYRTQRAEKCWRHFRETEVKQKLRSCWRTRAKSCGEDLAWERLPARRLRERPLPCPRILKR